MSEAITLKKRNRNNQDDCESFGCLRREAIKSIQAVSGKIWTDYNLHDPGITILEQLLYVITELNYRSDFPMEDYLVDENNRIDYTNKALYAPEDIFPSRAITLSDYKKLFLNSVSEIDNIWMTIIENSDIDYRYDGMHKISIKLSLNISSNRRNEILNEISNIYQNNRNLCEDLASIYVVENVVYSLHAKVEIYETYDPVIILAEIYFECAKIVSRRINATKQYPSENDFGPFDPPGSLDEQYTGPFTSNGYYNDESFQDNHSEFLISSLFQVINNITGVNHIQQLHLQKDGECFHNLIKIDSTVQAFDLAIPELERALGVQLSINGREIFISIEDLNVKIDELGFIQSSSNSSLHDASLLYELPVGKHHSIRDYFSIKNQFPDIYGIGQFGLPKSASVAEKAKAMQLKSFLTIFEQHLVNYLSNIDSIGNLYSLNSNKETCQSYYFELIDQSIIAELFQDKLPDEFLGIYKKMEKDFLRIIKLYDQYNERKNRSLDYLLAIYGESVPQHSYRQFNYYHDNTQIETFIINQKISYLQAISDIGKNRSAGVNYTATAWQDCATTGIHTRVCLLLGFELYTARSLTMVILKQGVKLFNHRKNEHLVAGSTELKFIETDLIETSFDNVPVVDVEQTLPLSVIRQFVGELIPIANNLFSDVLFKYGVYIDRYKVGSLTNNRDFQLTFHWSNSQHWYLGTYPNKATACKVANYLRHFIIQLSKESEGFHLIEHILLSPLNEDNAPGMSYTSSDDFFSLQASIIFPSWTIRCENLQFQKYVEEVFEKNMPAHITFQIYWLDFPKMYEFETYYEHWMECKSAENIKDNDVDASAIKLVLFLLENQHTVNMYSDE